MARQIRPGSIQEAVRKSIRAVGGLECASDDLGVSVSLLSYGTEVTDKRPGGLGVNHLDKLGRIDGQAAVPMAQHFAHLAGGFFHPIETSGGVAADLSQITREFSDVLEKHAEAHSHASENPTGYTPKEASAQIKELDELIAAAANLRAALTGVSG